MWLSIDTKVETRNGQTFVISPGNVEIDVSEWSEETRTLQNYYRTAMFWDLKFHRYTVRCGNCWKDIIAYPNTGDKDSIDGKVHCEKCVSETMVKEMAECLNSPWYDFLREIKRQKKK